MDEHTPATDAAPEPSAAAVSPEERRREQLQLLENVRRVVEQDEVEAIGVVMIRDKGSAVMSGWEVSTVGLLALLGGIEELKRELLATLRDSR